MADVRTVAWQRADENRGHSFARMAGVDGERVFHGCEVLAGPAVGLACWFRVRLDKEWRTRDVEVRAVGDAGERLVRLTADEQRRWSVDGVRRPELDGCLDVDIAATPVTNTFPIRRLAGLSVGESVTSPIAWVSVPELTVNRVDQTYRKVPPVDGHNAWEYSDPIHGAFFLTVDGDGLVVDYEHFAHRVLG
jgi:uncharacterized protein